jgi:hypothetical protein
MVIFACSARDMVAPAHEDLFVFADFKLIGALGVVRRAGVVG